MKKFVLFAILFLNASLVFAQCYQTGDIQRHYDVSNRDAQVQQNNQQMKESYESFMMNYMRMKAITGNTSVSPAPIPPNYQQPTGH